MQVSTNIYKNNLVSYLTFGAALRWWMRMINLNEISKHRWQALPAKEAIKAEAEGLAAEEAKAEEALLATEAVAKAEAELKELKSSPNFSFPDLHQA